MKYIFLFLCIFTSIHAQTKKNNLLLLRIEKENDLKIDKHQTKLFVIELDSLNEPLKGNGMMSVLINDFSDAMLEKCIKEKVVNVNDVYTSGSFNSVTNYGEENFEKILKNFKYMHFLSSIKIKDLAYNKMIKIYYTLVKVNYCVGEQFIDDKWNSCDNGKIVILSSSLKLNNEYKIPKTNLYEVLKMIDFNKFMVN